MSVCEYVCECRTRYISLVVQYFHFIIQNHIILRIQKTERPTTDMDGLTGDIPRILRMEYERGIQPKSPVNCGTRNRRLMLSEK